MAAPDTTTAPAAVRPAVRAPWAYLGLLALSMVLLALAYPGPGWGWLAHVALVPAGVLALRAHCARRLAWTSFLAFFAWWFYMLWWMRVVTFGGTIGLAGLMAAYGALALVVFRVLVRRWRLPALLALPLAWVSAELVRGNFLSGGYGWFSLGVSQAPYRPGEVGYLVQIADLFGEQGVSFLVAMTNGLVIDLVVRPWRSAKTPEGVRAREVVVGGTILWIIVTALAWAWGSAAVGLTDVRAHSDSPRHLRIATIQTNVPQDNKERATPAQEEANWQRLLELTRQAAAASPKPDLIVWPETMVPAALNAETIDYHRTVSRKSSTSELLDQQIRTLARTWRVSLLVGGFAYQDWSQTIREHGREYVVPRQQYNSAYLYRPDGTQNFERYDKVHRVPFGEYIPWVEQWPWLKEQFIRYLSPYPFDYTVHAGTVFTVFEVVGEGGQEEEKSEERRAKSDSSQPATRNSKLATRNMVRLATPICFEDTVGRVCRRMIYGPDGRKRADVLVNLTNEGWFAAAPYERQRHLQAAVLRCIENRVPMVRSANTGISGFIDAGGRIGPVVSVAGQSERVDGWLAQDVRPDSRVTLFGRWGATPLWALAAVTGVLVVAGGFGRKKRTG